MYGSPVQTVVVLLLAHGVGHLGAVAIRPTCDVPIAVASAGRAGATTTAFVCWCPVEDFTLFTFVVLRRMPLVMSGK